MDFVSDLEIPAEGGPFDGHLVQWPMWAPMDPWTLPGHAGQYEMDMNLSIVGDKNYVWVWVDIPEEEC